MGTEVLIFRLWSLCSRWKLVRAAERRQAKSHPSPNVLSAHGLFSLQVFQELSNFRQIQRATSDHYRGGRLTMKRVSWAPCLLFPHLARLCHRKHERTPTSGAWPWQGLCSHQMELSPSDFSKWYQLYHLQYHSRYESIVELGRAVVENRERKFSWVGCQTQSSQISCAIWVGTDVAEFHDQVLILRASSWHLTDDSTLFGPCFFLTILLSKLCFLFGSVLPHLFCEQ